jgi:hypothetical protein
MGIYTTEADLFEIDGGIEGRYAEVILLVLLLRVGGRIIVLGLLLMGMIRGWCLVVPV